MYKPNSVNTSQSNSSFFWSSDALKAQITRSSAYPRYEGTKSPFSTIPDLEACQHWYFVMSWKNYSRIDTFAIHKTRSYVSVFLLLETPLYCIHSNYSRIDTFAIYKTRSYVMTRQCISTFRDSFILYSNDLQRQATALVCDQSATSLGFGTINFWAAWVIVVSPESVILSLRRYTIRRGTQ